MLIYLDNRLSVQGTLGEHSKKYLYLLRLYPNGLHLKTVRWTRPDEIYAEHVCKILQRDWHSKAVALVSSLRGIPAHPLPIMSTNNRYTNREQWYKADILQGGVLSKMVQVLRGEKIKWGERQWGASHTGGRLRPLLMKTASGSLAT